MTHETNWLKRLLGSDGERDIDAAVRAAVEQVRVATEGRAAAEQRVIAQQEEIAHLTAEQKKSMVRLAQLSDERNALSSRLDESGAKRRTLEEQLGAEKARTRELTTHVDELTGKLESERRAHAAELERIASLERQRAQQTTALRYERRRWRALAGTFWQALVGAVGDAAPLAVTRVLEREADPTEGLRVTTTAAASAALGKLLRARALANGATVIEEAGGMSVRIQPAEPTLPEDAVPAWVGPIAAHFRGRILGLRLQADRIVQEDVALRLTVRSREGAVVTKSRAEEVEALGG